jgi:photosystem II stability/assembly factor-like uncharacterized protein
VGDHVLFTTDGGSTWKDVTPPESEAASGDRKTAIGFFQDAKTAWVTYANYVGYPVPTQVVVWHTADGGAIWQASQPLDVQGLSEIFVPSDLQFVLGQTGWLLVHVGVGMNHDYVALYHSLDGGINWSRILDPYNDGGIQSCTKSAMLFTDLTHGWLTGDCNGVKAGVLLTEACGVTERDALSRNIDGELEATLRALEWSAKVTEPIIICYDYEGVRAWATGQWKANSHVARNYIEKLRSLRKPVSFNKLTGHSGHAWNDYADNLAKKGIKEYMARKKGVRDKAGRD